MKHLFVFLFLFQCSAVFAQKALESLQKGIALQEQSQFQEAILPLQEASRLFREGKDYENYLLSQSRIGFNLIKINQLPESIKLLENNTNEAKSLSAKPDFWKAQNEYYIAEAQLNLGRYEIAKEITQRNINFLLKENYPELLAQTYNLLGIVFWQEGNNNLALEYIEKGLDIRQQHNSAEIAASYNDLGLVYQNIDMEKALNFYQKALNTYKNRLPSVHSKNAILLSNIGIIKLSQKEYAEAQEYFEKAQHIWQKIYPKQSHPSEAFVINNLGRVFLMRKQNNTANQYFLKALKIYQDNFGNEHPEIANTYNFIAEAYYQSGEYKNALLYSQEALIANSNSFTSKNIAQNPNLQNVYGSNTFLYSLMLKAEVLEAQYVNKSVRLSDLKNALVCIQIADTLLNHLRQKASSKADKLLLGQTAAQTYQLAVRVCNLLATETQQHKKYISQAFYFSEKAKAIVLLEAISESKAKSFGNIPANLLKEEEDLRVSISYVEQQIALKPAENDLNKYKTELFELNRKYEEFQKKLEKAYPDYYNLKYSSKPISIEALQAKLDKETLLLDYMLGNEQIFVFKINHKKVQLLTLPKSPDFESDVTYLLNAIRFSSLKPFTRMAHQLYKDIFPKNIPKSIKRIVVVQDGKLAMLPMETLLSKAVETEKNTDFGSFPYLIQKWAFSYAYSATLWVQNLQKNTHTGNQEIALIAPISFEENIASLPGTEKEVQEIAAVCRAKKFKVNTLLREEAQERVLKNLKMDNFSVLHFATHGLVDEESPELSQIFLNRSEGEDGNLFAGEIFNLRLNADLVTLSACEVGLGKVSKGEGLIGLGRAFLYAGAKNLVLSLWRVSDESTARLMILFYTQKFADAQEHYADALRTAKLQLLQEKNYAKPYYWAAFLLLGK
jgi:CHAT domain-containing protein/tetratricopeptide (TPR) repeat protein